MIIIWRSTEGLFRRLRRVSHLLRRGDRPRERLYPIRHRRDPSFTTPFPRSDDSGCMEYFAKPSRAQLDAAFPYERLTITGNIGDALWDPFWQLRLAADDDAKGELVTVARALAHKRRDATAWEAVDAWNQDRTQPVPVLSVLEEGGSRRCAILVIADGTTRRADDYPALEPLADAVAAAGGRLVVLKADHRDADLDLVLVSPHVDVKSLGTWASTSLKASGAIVYGNGRNSFWAALAEEDDDDEDDDAEDEAPSVASRPRRGARVPVAPPKPVKSPEEIAALPCFMLDALTRGRPVLDDDAEPFRAHYSCFERRRTDPNEQRKRSNVKIAWERYGEFYPLNGRGGAPAFVEKDPPEVSYAAAVEMEESEPEEDANADAMEEEA